MNVVVCTRKEVEIHECRLLRSRTTIDLARQDGSTSEATLLPTRESASQSCPNPHFDIFGLAFSIPSNSLHSLLHRLRNAVFAPQSTRRVFCDHVPAILQDAFVVTPESESSVAVILVAVGECVRSAPTTTFLNLKRPWNNAVDDEIVSVFRDSSVLCLSNLLERTLSLHRFEKEGLGGDIETLIGFLAGQLEVDVVLIDVLLLVVESVGVMISVIIFRANSS